MLEECVKEADLVEGLVEENFHLAKQAAGEASKKYGYKDIAELYTDALYGLFRAALKFDVDKGVGFETYARSRIGGAIKDGVRFRDGATRSQHEMYGVFYSAFSNLTNSLAREPYQWELVEELGKDFYQLPRSKLIGEDKARLIIDTVLGYGSTVPLSNEMCDVIPCFSRVEFEFLDFEEMISSLSEREKTVMRSLYVWGETLKSTVAMIEGVNTVAGIANIRDGALGKLRSRAKKEGWSL